MRRYLQRAVIAMAVPTAALALTVGGASAQSNPGSSLASLLHGDAGRGCTPVLTRFLTHPQTYANDPEALAALIASVPQCQTELVTAIGAAAEAGLITQDQANTLDKAIGCDPTSDIGVCGHRPPPPTQ